MKITFTLVCCIVLSAFAAKGQIFWSENFESGTTGGLGGPTTLVSAYSGPAGLWTLTVTGTEGPSYNQWYVSCAENGHTTGGCGTACSTGTGITGASLHVGSTTIGDLGASYDAGGLANTTTDRRATSPVINCTGKYGITLKFYYTMNGQAGIDYGTVWYYDGSTWSLLASPPRTPAICLGGQGYWDHYSVALPVSADNNANVKIGFRWVNNNDGVGTDPSFAVDSVNLSTATTTVAPTPLFTTSAATGCPGDCINFTNTSTGTVDSFTWSMPGVTIATPHTSPVSVCFSVAGTYTMTLTDYRSGTPYTVSHTVTINPLPAAITGSHTVCVGLTIPLTNTTAGGAWSSSTPAIATVGSSTGIVSGLTAGTTTISYTLPTGCFTTYTMTVTPAPCTTGIELTPGAPTGLDIYPNPAANELTVQCGAATYQSFTITNELGQTLITGKLTQTNTKIDLKILPPGLYYIKVKGSDGNTVRKFDKL